MNEFGNRDFDSICAIEDYLDEVVGDMRRLEELGVSCPEFADYRERLKDARMERAYREEMELDALARQYEEAAL